MALRVCGVRLADMLRLLFPVDADGVVKTVVGTLDAMPTLLGLEGEKLQPGERIILAGIGWPMVEEPVEPTTYQRQSYRVPVFAVARVNPAQAEAPWVLREALLNVLLSRIDPWVKARQDDTSQLELPDGFGVIATAAIEDGDYAALPELLADNYCAVSLTVRIDVTAIRT